MLNSGISVNTANFRVEDFDQRKAPSMSRRYSKRIVYLLILGAASVLVYFVFSASRMHAGTGWAGGVLNMHVQGNVQDDAQDSIEEDMQDNNLDKQGNIQDFLEDNLEENKKDNDLDDKQDNIKDDIKEDIQDDIHDNIVENRKDNRKHGHKNLDLDAAADSNRAAERVSGSRYEPAAGKQKDVDNKDVEGEFNDNLKDPEKIADDRQDDVVNVVKGLVTENVGNDVKNDTDTELNKKVVIDENKRYLMEHSNVVSRKNKNINSQDIAKVRERLKNIKFPPEFYVTNEQGEIIGEVLLKHGLAEFITLRNQARNNPANDLENQKRLDEMKHLDVTIQTFDEFLEDQRLKGINNEDRAMRNNRDWGQMPIEELGDNLPNKNLGEQLQRLKNPNPFAPDNVEGLQNANQLRGVNDDALHNHIPFLLDKAKLDKVNPLAGINNNLLDINPRIPAGNKNNDNLLDINPLIQAGNKINEWRNQGAGQQNNPFNNGAQQAGFNGGLPRLMKPNLLKGPGDLQLPRLMKPNLPKGPGDLQHAELLNRIQQNGADDFKHQQEKQQTEDVNAAANSKVACLDYKFPTGAGKLCIPSGDISPSVFSLIHQDAVHARSVMNEILLILKSDRILNFIDIGAGMGWYSTFAALLSRDVYACEPLKSNQELIHHNIKANKVFYRVKVMDHAVDSEPYSGLVKPAEDAESYGQVHLSRLPSGIEQSSITGDTHVVEVKTLNELAADLPVLRALVRFGFLGGIGDNFLDTSDAFFRKIEAPYIITHWPGSKPADAVTKITATLNRLGYQPQLTWDGPGVSLNSPLQTDYKYLVWKKL